MTLIEYSQIFYVNSLDRTAGTSSNFTYKFNNIDQTNDYNKICVLNMCIPKTYYLISSINNSFTLQEDVTQVMITVPSGNYSKTSFRVTIQNLLNTLSPNHYTYTITEDNVLSAADTGLYHFSVSNNGGIQPIIIVSSEVHNQLGFQPNTSNVFVGNLLNSTHIVNFNLKNTLYLHSDICQNNNGNNVLQEIFTTGIPTNSYIQFVCVDVEAYSKTYLPKQDSFTFYLTDSENNPIDLNGIEMNLTVIIYKKSDIDSKIAEYINIKKNQLYLDLKK